MGGGRAAGDGAAGGGRRDCVGPATSRQRRRQRPGHISPAVVVAGSMALSTRPSTSRETPSAIAKVPPSATVRTAASMS